MYKHPFRLPFHPPFQDAFLRPYRDIFPPVEDKLLLWAPGDLQDGDTVAFDENEPFDENAPFGVYRRDRSRSAVNYPMKVSRSHCIRLTVGDTILTDSHGTLVDNGGTAVLSYNGTTVTVDTEGTIFDIEFSDETVFHCAEGSGLNIYSPDGVRAAVTTSESLWDTYQDYNHNNVWNGFGYGENLTEWSEDLTEWAVLGSPLVTAATNNWTLIEAPIDGDDVRVVIPAGNFPWTESGTLVVGSQPNHLATSTNEQKYTIVLEDTVRSDFYTLSFSVYSESLYGADNTISPQVDKVSDGRAVVTFRGFPQALSTTYKSYVKDVQLTAGYMERPILGTLVCAGDSISINYQARLPEYVDATIIDSSVGGDTIQDLIDRFAIDVAAHSPDTIALMIGANSMGDGVIESMKVSMLALLALCDATGAATVIHENIPRTGWAQGVQDTQDEWNAWLSTLGYTFVNNYSDYLENGTDYDLDTRYTTDGVHPNNFNSSIILARNFALAVGMVLPVYIATKDYSFNGTEKLPFLNTNPAGQWNDAESSYSVTDNPVLGAAAMIAADLLEGEFMYTAGVETPHTQAEMEVYYADKSYASFGCNGLIHYDRILIGEELYEMLKYNCRAEAVIVDGEVVTVDGVTVFVRGDYA